MLSYSYLSLAYSLPALLKCNRTNHKHAVETPPCSWARLAPSQTASWFWDVETVRLHGFWSSEGSPAPSGQYQSKLFFVQNYKLHVYETV